MSKAKSTDRKKMDAKGAKKTWWNELRVKNNYLLKEIAETLGVSTGAVGNWFCGKNVPSEEYARDICDLFGVNYDDGYNHFIKDNKVWDSERGHLDFTLRHLTSATERPASADTSIAVEPIVIDEETPACHNFPTDTVESIPVSEQKSDKVEIVDEDFSVLKYFYSKLSYDEYENLRTFILAGGDPLELLYGKLGYKEYNELYDLLQK